MKSQNLKYKKMHIFLLPADGTIQEEKRRKKKSKVFPTLVRQVREITYRCRDSYIYLPKVYHTCSKHKESTSVEMLANHLFVTCLPNIFHVRII